MIQRFVSRFLLLLLSGHLASSLWGAEPAPAAKSTAAEVASISTRPFRLISPGPADGKIASVTAQMLQRFHYLRQPFDDTMSSKFLDRYLETLDPQHLHFLQSDLAEFEVYRTNLDQLTLPPNGVADTQPACEIYNRFVQRLQQRVRFVEEVLKNEKFTFETDDKILLNRKDEPYPKDMAEARKLWHERLRFEYLQETLGKIEARKKAAAKPASTAVSPEDAQTNSAPASTPAVAATKPKKSDAEEIVETLTNRYRRNLHMFADWDNDDVLQIYLTTLARVYDPHSDYFGHSQLDSFAITMNLSLFGIGAELTSEDGYCTIHRLLPGGPAAKSKKLKEKDRIVAVAQSNQPPVDVVDMSLNKAVQLIRGPKGTEVRLTIIPAGEDSSTRTVLTLIRDEIKLEDQEAKAKIIELPGTHGETVRLGVIDLPSFYASFDPANTRGKAEPKSTTADVARLLTKLKAENVGGVILDLRRNGGGSLEEAIRLTGLFIKKGPVVQVRDYDGTVQEDEDDDPSVLWEGPLVVLTSRLSASASEILAGALQDYGRALIVGDASTHGKGTVQSVQPLKMVMRPGSYPLTNDPGALKLTIKKFYRASGASTQLKGVVPDIVLPSVFNESKDIGESALDNPLPWDTIPSAEYERYNLVEPYLPELRQRSAARIAADKDFQYVREDIEIFKKQQADKTISLNQEQRLREKEEADARAKARDRERLARAERPETIYELTLKQALLPGLPPPLAKTNTAVAKVSGKNADATLGTNAMASAHDGLGSAFEDPDEDKPPAVDAVLTESQHILVDYLSILPKGNLLTAGH